MATDRKGLRCHVCTGCGLCPGVTARGSLAGKIHILTDETEGAGDTAPFLSGKYVAAIDLGTTTVAMVLYDEKGQAVDRMVAVNPQVNYGADVISRIQAAKEGAAEELRLAVFELLEQGFTKFAKKVPENCELTAVIAGNTTETYLLLGLDTEELGHAPFYASHLEAEEITIAGVSCFVFPGLSAFVGGDIMAGIYAADLAEREVITLLIDLGTNGELVLGNREKCIAAATAAGPAFEGGVNRGVWGADMVSLLARLRREELVDESGLLAEPYFDKGIRIGNVTVTQQAIRSIQTAKAAIAAGITILLEEYGITYGDIDRVILAGGFGYYLDPKDAAEIGLLPVALVEKTYAGGNTSLRGCRKAGSASREDVTTRCKRIFDETKCINLAQVPAFAENYVSKMELRPI